MCVPPVAAAADADDRDSVASTCWENAARQSQRLLETLRTCYRFRGLDPYWGNQFWIAVHDMECTGVEPVIVELLYSSGYCGPRTLSPPIFDELEHELARLAGLASQARVT